MNGMFSAEWWISVAAVGVAINLVSAYLKRYIDKTFSSFSSRYRMRSEKAKSAYESTVNMLVSSPEMRLCYFAQSNSRSHMGTSTMIFSAFLGITAALAHTSGALDAFEYPILAFELLFGYSFLGTMYGYHLHNRAVNDVRHLTDATTRILEIQSERHDEEPARDISPRPPRDFHPDGRSMLADLDRQETKDTDT